MSRADRRLEKQALRLFSQAQHEARHGRTAKAVQLQEQAVELCRTLAEQHPGDPVHPLAMASALYSLGGMLTAAGRPADSIEALDESERLYHSISGLPRIPDTAPLTADISARRALALAVDGRGASAVPEAEIAVAFYEELAAGDILGSRQRDLARVCAGNAKILTRFGDPDVAAASADRALRIYLSHRPAQGRFAIAAEDAGYLKTAGSVAATIHAWHGRIEVALTAAQLALEFGGAAPVRQSLLSVHARVDAMIPARRADFGRKVAAALHELAESPSGVVAGQPDDSDDVATAAFVFAVLRQVAAYLMPPPSAGSAELTTLAGALAHAGHEELGADITRPALDCAITTPGARCSPQLAPVHAQRLADMAVLVLGSSTADGIRMGLEAHYMYAAASRLQVTAMRYQFADFGPAWARDLLACSAAFEQCGDLRMALDLASWSAGAARQLMPFSLLDARLTKLVRRCIERHGHMLIATGSRQDGEAALATAQAIADPGGS